MKAAYVWFGMNVSPLLFGAEVGMQQISTQPNGCVSHIAMAWWLTDALGRKDGEQENTFSTGEKVHRSLEKSSLPCNVNKCSFMTLKCFFMHSYINAQSAKTKQMTGEECPHPHLCGSSVTTSLFTHILPNQAHFFPLPPIQQLRLPS